MSTIIEHASQIVAFPAPAQVAGHETWCKSFLRGSVVKCGPAGSPRGGLQLLSSGVCVMIHVIPKKFCISQLSASSSNLEMRPGLKKHLKQRKNTKQSLILQHSCSRFKLSKPLENPCCYHTLRSYPRRLGVLIRCALKDRRSQLIFHVTSSQLLAFGRFGNMGH